VSDYKFQLNIKFDGGYDAPLLNVVGETQDEFRQNVEFAMASADAIIDAALAFQQGYQLKKPKDEPAPPPAQSWSSGGSQQQSQPASAPAGPPPTCRHGEMKYVPAGISKRTQKAYKAFYSCTGPRQEQCDTVDG
jgi:hypothetical protein